jgi:hypothetical protein
MENLEQENDFFVKKHVSRDSKERGRRKIRLIEGNAKCGHLKKLTYNGTLRQVFIRVYRLVFMLVFSTQLCELLPSNLLSGSTLLLSPPSLCQSTVYTDSRQCVAGMGW